MFSEQTGTRKSGLVGPLLELAPQLEQGLINQQQFLEQLDKAQGRFDRLQERMQEALQSGANVEAYREGALESLDDAFHLLELGLKELSSFLSGQDRRPLRLGRLLLEKGEQEYMAVLELLQNQTLGSERERTLDLWGQLSFEASRFCKGEIASQEWAEILSWGEWAMGAHMDGTFRDFQRAVGLLRSQPELPQEAQKKVLASLNRLKEFLGLSVGDGEAYAASLLTSKLKPDVLDKLTHFVDQGPTL